MRHIHVGLDSIRLQPPMSIKHTEVENHQFSSCMWEAGEHHTHKNSHCIYCKGWNTLWRIKPHATLCPCQSRMNTKEIHTSWSSTHPKVHHHGGSRTGVGWQVEESGAEHWDQRSQCGRQKESECLDRELYWSLFHWGSPPSQLFDDAWPEVSPLLLLLLLRILLLSLLSLQAASSSINF